jgi:hypothetical protein
LFFEQAPLRAGRGRIGHAVVDAQGEIGPVRTVIDEPFYVSYPFCVRAPGGDLPGARDSPETARLPLPRMPLPDDWNYERMFLDDVAAADATIVKPDGRLWLLACVGASDDPPGDELFAYHAESLSGPWHPHACNPIVSDVPGAAGWTLFHAWRHAHSPKSVLRLALRTPRALQSC